MQYHWKVLNDDDGVLTTFCMEYRRQVGYNIENFTILTPSPAEFHAAIFQRSPAIRPSRDISSLNIIHDVLEQEHIPVNNRKELRLVELA